MSDHPDLAAHLTSEGGLSTVVIVVAISAVVLRRADWTPRTTA